MASCFCFLVSVTYLFQSTGHTPSYVLYLLCLRYLHVVTSMLIFGFLRKKFSLDQFQTFHYEFDHQTRIGILTYIRHVSEQQETNKWYPLLTITQYSHSSGEALVSEVISSLVVIYVKYRPTNWEQNTHSKYNSSLSHLI